MQQIAYCWAAVLQQIEKDVSVYPNFFLFRKLPIASRFASCSLPTNRRKKPLMHFKKNRPIVAPVAPTIANRRGSSEASNTKNDERIIQVGGIKIGAAFTAINKKEYSDVGIF